MPSGSDDFDRRAIIARCLVAGGALAAVGAARAAASPERHDASLDVRRDFGARGDGVSDDTAALQAAIHSGSQTVRPITLPPGAYKITRALAIPPNTMLIGSAPGLGFGCRIEPTGCAAFVIGGSSPSFQCAIENLLIWPRGPAPDFIISIDNSFSVTVRNLRIHDAQEHLTKAAVLLLGSAASGGHGQCNNIIWDNLIVRNDSGQPPIAVLAASGCGTHRFFAPDLENYAVLLDWRGGQLDLFAPYTERAGRYGILCNPDTGDEQAYLSTFGGLVNAANSGQACAIMATARNFNSFGTAWGTYGGPAGHVYGLPMGPVTFHGGTSDFGVAARARFAGVEGWRQYVNFQQSTLRASRPAELLIPGNSAAQLDIGVPGIEVGNYWARVMFNANTAGVLLNAYVSSTGVATVVATNATAGTVKLTGLFSVECGAA